MKFKPTHRFHFEPNRTRRYGSTSKALELKPTHRPHYHGGGVVALVPANGYEWREVEVEHIEYSDLDPKLIRKAPIIERVLRGNPDLRARIAQNATGELANIVARAAS